MKRVYDLYQMVAFEYLLPSFHLFSQICVAMATSLPPKPGMAGMPPQQQPHLPPSSASAQGQQAMPPQGGLREISPVFLCRIGQETVQDIVTRTMEIFQITRATQVLKFYLVKHYLKNVLNNLLI